jgi:hypothetical protein
MQKLLTNPFTLDLRSLGLFRIFLGLVVILDLIIRMEDLQAHYTNQGILPIPALILYNWVDQFFSLHMATGNFYLILLLFIIAGVSAIFFTIGYHTRLFTIIVWFLTISVQSRNPFIEQGGDDLLRLMLFWGIFLPLGACFSVDAQRNGNRPEKTEYFHVANIGLILLICSVYFFSAMLKTGAEWRTEGTAVYYALSLDQIQLPGGRLLRQYPELCRYLTHAVFYLEAAGPLLLLIPVFTGFFRWVFIILLGMMHIGIGFTLYVGLFYIINLVSLIALLPPDFFRFFYKIQPALEEWFRKLNLVIADLKHRYLPPYLFRLPGFKAESFTVSCICSFIIFYCLLWNIAGAFSLRFPAEIKLPGYFFRLDQSWGMFSPTVFKDDGWYILEATLDAGQVKMDLKTRNPVNYDKPSYVLGGIKNDRWRKYLENYLFISNAGIRPYYCNYLLNKWNTDYPDKKIKKLEVIYMKEITPPPGSTGKVTRELLCGCGN